ncbi:hypothetical protein IG631_13486 [Alternaria alternata]|nr:hypothetical protein IG631_13486 [Alternaria alternata]
MTGERKVQLSELSARCNAQWGDCADVLCRVRKRTVARFNLECDRTQRLRCASDFYEIRSEPEFKEAVGIGRKS